MIQAQQINWYDQSVNPPILKVWEIALPNPPRIDAPGAHFISIVSISIILSA